MELLKNRILKDGEIIENRILKVDSFLNHQLDVNLFNEIGKEFKRRFEDQEVTKILTIETSGIAIACIAAQYFNVPVVFAKKHAGGNMDKDVYESRVYSFTKKSEYKIKVSEKYIKAEDKILIIDDFLASGSAISGLIDIVEKANAVISGVGIVIEKSFQGGRELILNKGIKLESLAVISKFDQNTVIFK
ncbi:xanthine phosphoribosyltransferase [Clostridium thailandense]|uniref:Xanthine phosphoribosyltransferase n=1 Tax=Clostridium thailandense TaxID=2794346 RepID=A0A949TUU0_9CLOT|nr:xanthine phosphoribosyltransferase [Clostridium thailandense]MBV7272281.1 xanthine phosphoribosyltransferase [Clostridium thailandense]MCH5136757.1 xanthine phosphoribosyltransferase [Clostridiaceae bacterium UIB06]